MLLDAILAVLAILPQENPREEKIVAVIPDFYLPDGRFTKDGCGVVLNPPPEEAIRKYFIKPLDRRGKFEAEYAISEEAFYRMTRSIIDYGVRDTADFSSYINDGYKNLILLLLEKGIVDRKELKRVFDYYIALYDHAWIESAYYLTEAVPDLLEPNDPIWHTLIEKIKKTADHTTDYFRALSYIRAGVDRNILYALIWSMNVRMKVDLELNEQDIIKADFYRYAKAFAILSGKDLISEEAELNLFKCYFHYNKDLLPSVKEVYASIGLRLPKKEILTEGFAYWMQTPEALSLNIVPELRVLGIKVPKGSAVRYRDTLLRNLGDLEDIEYLNDSMGEDARPELWQIYADSALIWHKRKEKRKQENDSDDYFHIAIIGYQRAVKGGLKLSPALFDELLKESEDLSVRMADVIAVYELKGANPKSSKSILEILEARLEKYKEAVTDRKLTEGARWDIAWSREKNPDLRRNIEIFWHFNEYGQEVIPFRDEIELAAYLDNPERTRQLSCAISIYVYKKLKEEGGYIKKTFLDEKYFKTSKSPIYAELTAILDLYESLKFTDGARSLAQHLHSVGFKLPARRAFRIGGFEKEAEEQYFNWKDDAYWLQQEGEFNYSTRKKELENNIEKTGTHWVEEELKSTIQVKDKK